MLWSWLRHWWIQMEPATIIIEVMIGRKVRERALVGQRDKVSTRSLFKQTYLHP